MMKWILVLLFFIVAVVMAADFGKFSPNLQSLLKKRSQRRVNIWVFFHVDGKTQKQVIVSQKALARRRKVGYDEKDIVLNEDYVNQVLNATENGSVRTHSTILNGISLGDVTMDELETISDFKFVTRLDLVEVYREKIPDGPSQIQKREGLNYGRSFPQLSQLNIPAAHKQGIYHYLR